METMGVRLGVVKQSFFGSPGTYIHYIYETHHPRITSWNNSILSLSSRSPEICRCNFFKKKISKYVTQIQNVFIKSGNFWVLSIGLLQLTITLYKIRHAGGQAHYYSPTGTLKQRQVRLDWFRSLCFNVPMGE